MGMARTFSKYGREGVEGLEALVRRYGILGRGSTGRAIPETLEEYYALESVMADPSLGEVIEDIVMSDPRWPASEGWVKCRVKVGDSFIHYVYNTVTKAIDDFKFK